MKITVKQLALSLYESVEGKTPSQAKQVIGEFVALLAKKNLLARADKIILEFTKIWHIKHGIVEAQVASVNGLNKTEVKLLKDYIAKISRAKEVLLSEEISAGILGGVIIKYEDKILDGSLKTQINELKNKMIK